MLKLTDKRKFNRAGRPREEGAIVLETRNPYSKCFFILIKARSTTYSDQLGRYICT